MTKKEYIQKLDTLIEVLENNLETVDEEDHIEKMRILGIQNGLLQAKLWALEIE